MKPLAPFASALSKTFGPRLINKQRLTKIDEHNIYDHDKLTVDDECYFWLEYTSGRGYAFSLGNNIIYNLKMKPTKSGAKDLIYKDRAIKKCSDAFSKVIESSCLNGATIIPIPPSKTKSHPDYDDRMSRICRGIRAHPPLDVRELVVQTKSINAAHEGRRPSVNDLLEIYQIDQRLTKPAPKTIIIFDDLLTAGVHYRAIHTVLRRHFPNATITAIFVARRIFPPSSLSREEVEAQIRAFGP